MKNYIISFCMLSLLLFSCNNDDDAAKTTIDVAVPITMELSEFRNSVKVSPAEPTVETGKIYVYNDYIFVAEKNKGIHVIDNSEPSNPHTISFIHILGNEDISIKGDYLYADSAIDLVVFNISDINNIQIENRLTDVFSRYDYHWPVDVQRVRYDNFDYATEIVIGWNVVKETIDKDEVVFIFNETKTLVSSSSTGVGGSLARFQIYKEYLFTVGSYEMAIFDISNLSNPMIKNKKHVGWNIETMFEADDYLYLGSTNGMYIYSLENTVDPEYISEFTHWEGCDPVVVDGDYAYLTLRGGNACGQLESVLEVIDVKDKTNPTMVGRYNLENPYGLGFRANTLYVCDGTAGLKLYDKSNPETLLFQKTFKGIQATDVIPLENSLIMIGGNIIYQYEYLDGDLNLISAFNL